MPVFFITTRDVVVTTYRVEAETEQVAIDKTLDEVPNNRDLEEWDQYYEGSEVVQVEQEEDSNG